MQGTGDVNQHLQHTRGAETHSAAQHDDTRHHLLVNDAACRRHPLHVAGADDVLVADRVAVLHFALEGNCDGLEAAVGVLADPAPLCRRVEMLRGRVVKHEPRRELLREGELAEDWKNMEPVTNPVGPRRGNDLAHGLRHCCCRHPQNLVAAAGDVLAGLVGVHRAHRRGRGKGCRALQNRREPHHPNCKAGALYRAWMQACVGLALYRLCRQCLLRQTHRWTSFRAVSVFSRPSSSEEKGKTPPSLGKPTVPCA